MIWLTWRQFRVQAVIAAAALAAFAILLGVTGPHLASLYGSTTVGCHDAPACASSATTFLSRMAVTSPYPTVYLLGLGLILFAPAIIGIFWGAPLIARELETRTFALAWTQSISRTRWLAAKIGLTGLAAMAVTEALSLMYAWWGDPIGKAIGRGGTTSYLFNESRLSLIIFATHGITPLGYAAFGFALGTSAGVVFRRALPAMAVTLVIFAAAQIAMPLWVRPHLIPPERTISTIDAAQLNYGSLTATAVPRHPGAWILSSEAVNRAGRPVSAMPAVCQPPPPAKPPDPGQCMGRLGIRETITYQPVSRYWAFQWIETGIFLALALALAGFCFWRIGSRRT